MTDDLAPPAKRTRKSEMTTETITELNQRYVDTLKSLIASDASIETIVSFAKAPLIQKRAPQFTTKAVFPDKSIGELSLSDYAGKWVVLFFYPLDFTFVCPTEIVAFGDRQEEFEILNCQAIAASCDSAFSHLAWINTPRIEGGLGDMKIPIVADFDKKVATTYGVLLEEGIPLRGLFLIDPSGKIRHATLNDLPVGRSVDECLRILRAFQHTDEYGEVCPANWTPGDRTMKPGVHESKEYFQAVNSGSA